MKAQLRTPAQKVEETAWLRCYCTMKSLNLWPRRVYPTLTCRRDLCLLAYPTVQSVIGLQLIPYRALSLPWSLVGLSLPPVARILTEHLTLNPGPVAGVCITSPRLPILQPANSTSCYSRIVCERTWEMLMTVVWSLTLFPATSRVKYSTIGMESFKEIELGQCYFRRDGLDWLG